MTKKNLGLIILIMIIVVVSFFALSHWVSNRALNVDEVTHQVISD